jgi:hypothetical protein
MVPTSACYDDPMVVAVAETRRARRQETPMVFVRAIVSAY